MNKLLHFFFGSYTLEFCSNDSVKVLNLLNSRNILFRGFEHGEEKAVIKLSLFSCEKALCALSDEKIEHKIVKTFGIPFLMGRYRNRYGLLLGLVCGLLLIFYSQLFIWQVTVIGNIQIPTEKIVKALANYGIGVGSYIPHIDAETEKNGFIVSFPELSSASLNIKGTHLYVEIIERVRPPDIEQTKGACEVVSSCDGIIVSISAAEGTPVVAVGDTVTEGQLLICALTGQDSGVVRVHHARGIVKALVYEKFSVCIPLERQYKVYTGKSAVRRGFSLLGHYSGMLPSEFSEFEKADVASESGDFLLFGFVKTPLKYSKTTYTEYIIKKQPISQNSAKKLAEDALNNRLISVTDELYSCETSGEYDLIQNAYILNADIGVIKDIAKDKELPPDWFINPSLPDLQAP